MLESQENRHFMRMAVNADVKVTVKNGKGKQLLDGVCLDLSAEGLSLQLPSNLDVGHKLFVEILSSGSVAPLKIDAEVVRSQRLDDNSGDFILGCRIISMD
ncbi:PilZ domain-containing protein [Idiomarina ramblicola]|uniref:PilZ domain-containing protein n=1 Tax=Idiomarina ramblicola TaxID=263724 RepID=A0A432Z4R3_9GAMM|nr:PilZ domain-containing protein [Idiomarina ramblicola]RUO72892.1 PilZ domain-containing protein [Idiomarina ramblicola]